MPAAAVIPAPIGYIKVVAVEKLVVVFLVGRCSGACVAKACATRGAACHFVGPSGWFCGSLHEPVAPLRH